MKDPIQLLSQNVAMADERGRMSSQFYRMMATLLRSIAGWSSPDALASVTLTGSPYAYTAQQPGQLFVNGGTVSAVTLTRAGTTVNAPAAGCYLTPGDTITVTYTVAPTVTFVPR